MVDTELSASIGSREKHTLWSLLQICKDLLGQVHGQELVFYGSLQELKVEFNLWAPLTLTCLFPCLCLMSLTMDKFKSSHLGSWGPWEDCSEVSVFKWQWTLLEESISESGTDFGWHRHRLFNGGSSVVTVQLGDLWRCVSSQRFCTSLLFFLAGPLHQAWYVL